MPMNVSSAQWQQFYPGLNVLTFGGCLTGNETSKVSLASVGEINKFWYNARKVGIILKRMIGIILAPYSSK